MGERKVISKYYPADFNPEAIPGRRKKGTPQLKVRMMLPMSLKCKSCGEYMYQGKKFNSRKETSWDENYLGLKIYRFYMRCPKCAAEFTIKTDPKNSDYVTEHNCVRNFEAWKDPNIQEEKEKEDKVKIENENDAMKLLENKTNISKQEMDAIDDLDEIKTINERNKLITVDDLLEKHRKEHEEKEEEDPKDLDKEVEEMFKTKTKRIIEESDKEEFKQPKKRKEEKFSFLEIDTPQIVSVQPKKKNSQEKTTKKQKKSITNLLSYNDD